jgi:hypothetical protein
MLVTASKHGLKILAAAALLGVAAAGTASLPARADSIRTNCLGDSCIRVQCDDWGDNCVQVARFVRDRDDEYAPYRARYVCDAYGDDCHWMHAPVYYQRSYDDDFGD